MKELKVTNHVHPYSYPKPVIKDLSYNKYEGLSIQEIENRYGKDEAQWVYFMATKGVDLTKPRFIEYESEPYVRVEIFKNGENHLYQIVIDKSENYTLFDVTIDESQVGEDAVREMVNSLLYDSLKSIGLLK